MPAVRSMVLDDTRLGTETLAAPGVPVQAIRDLASLAFTFTPAPDVKTVVPDGSKLATAGVLIREQTNFKFSGDGTYNELAWLLAGVLCDPVITTPGGGTLSRLLTYIMNVNAADTMRTFSLEKGSDAFGAGHYPYCNITDLTLTFNRNDKPKISGGGFGQAMIYDLVRWVTIGATAGTWTFTVGAATTAALAYNITAVALQTALAGLAGVGAGKVTVTGGPGATAPFRVLFDKSVNLTTVSVNGASLTGGSGAALSRLSPGSTQLAPAPISPGEISMYVAPSFALLDSVAALTMSFDQTWSITGRQNPYYPMNASYGNNFAGTNEVQPKSNLAFSVGADNLMSGYIANVRQQDLIFLRLLATGPIIEGALPYQLKIDTPMRIATISEDKDVSGGGVLGRTFSGEWMRDPTTGRGSVVTLQNTITAL